MLCLLLSIKIPKACTNQHMCAALYFCQPFSPRYFRNKIHTRTPNRFRYTSLTKNMLGNNMLTSGLNCDAQSGKICATVWEYCSGYPVVYIVFGLVLLQLVINFCCFLSLRLRMSRSETSRRPLDTGLLFSVLRRPRRKISGLLFGPCTFFYARGPISPSSPRPLPVAPASNCCLRSSITH